MTAISPLAIARQRTKCETLENAAHSQASRGNAFESHRAHFYNPAQLPESRLPAMNESRCGNFLNSSTGLLKFVASTSLGLPTIHWARSIDSYTPVFRPTRIFATPLPTFSIEWP